MEVNIAEGKEGPKVRHSTLILPTSIFFKDFF